MTFNLVYTVGAVFFGLLAMRYFGRRYGGGEEAESNLIAALIVAAIWPAVAAFTLVVASVALVIALWYWIVEGERPW